MNSIINALLLLTCSALTKQDDQFYLGDMCRNHQGIVDCSNVGLESILGMGDLANKTKTFYFDKNSIKKIRVMEPSWTVVHLSFSHNDISSIEDRAFERMGNLSILDLSHNVLTSECLRPVTFKGPDYPESVGILHLKILDLSSNALHTLHQDLFEFLPDLEELRLASNPLNVLDHGTLTALSSIHKIKALDFTSTGLKDLPPNWLNAAKYLETLNISLNHFETVPSSLEEARGLRSLILTGNPIHILSSFPKIPTLQHLEMNWMANLTIIMPHSLVNLTNLTDLSIANNHYLMEISEDALVEPGSYSPGSNEGAVFPPIDRLDLSNNRLQYLEEELFDSWSRFKVLKLDSNPWSCDCRNQWMVSKLVGIMTDRNMGAPHTLICGGPIEMKGMSMVELAMRDNYQMRCLDIYNNEPDKDAKVLIVVLVCVLIAIPLTLLLLHLINRPRNNMPFPSAYYRSTRSFESIN